MFLSAAAGHEIDPECGPRCQMCYGLRLDGAANFAKSNGFSYFATTLTLSPFKSTEVLNRIGARCGAKYGVEYIATDFQSGGGYQRSIELSTQYHLYRQKYCGCEFSKQYPDLESEMI